MQGPQFGGIFRLLAGTMIVLLALLAILVVLDIVPRAAFTETTVKLLSIGGIVLAASATLALLARR
jgi:hypothetical protein